DIRSYLNREWTLEFEDDFSGDAVDTETWSFEIGNGHSHGIPGWGNAELQYYTDEEQNAFIRDNHLVIRALEDVREDEFGTYSYTSARMISQDSVSVQYGRIDVRARLPHGQGIWPAVWMLGANLPEVGWPASGEIDIMEYLGHQTDRVHGTIHGPGYSGGGGIGDTYISDGEFSQDFHTFSLIWDEDIIIWLVDDEPFHVVTAEHVRRFYNADWVFNQEFFFILNMAVGGHWPGNPDDTTSFPQEMEIDYIRVYTPVE
ncbi:MAG: glycoside hydrolase family 16 protein, partial [Spirochaeta sp.]